MRKIEMITLFNAQIKGSLIFPPQVFLWENKSMTP